MNRDELFKSAFLSSLTLSLIILKHFILDQSKQTNPLENTHRGSKSEKSLIFNLNFYIKIIKSPIFKCRMRVKKFQFLYIFRKFLLEK